jgi:O-acetyl-ADP-ribose deacetylase (regulator of RNase III)
MDGGIDGSINALMTSFEPNQSYFHERVQKAILYRYCGEQPVGTTLLIPTHHPAPFRYVAHMPTMRVPEDVSTSLNAYLAFRSLLVEILWFNKKATFDGRPHDIISSVVCVPCCTSSGSMPYSRSTKQMKAAWKSVFIDPPKLEDWPSLHQAHRELKSF